MKPRLPGSRWVRGAGRYGLAASLVATAALLRWGLSGVLGETPYLAFYPAVVAASAFGGLGPGLLATLASALCVDVLFTSPVGQFSHDPLEWARQGVFFAGGAGTSIIAGRLREMMLAYRIVADNTYDWEFWLAPEGRFRYISPACLNLTGYPASAFEADPHLLERIIHPDDRALWRSHHRNSNEPCAENEAEFRIIRRDGGIRWIGHTCQPIYDEAGRFLGIRGSNRDITERKAAEASKAETERRLAGIIESAMDAIVIVDEAQQIVLFNPAAEKMFGCAAAEAIGSSIDRFIPAALRSGHREHMRHFGLTGHTARSMGHLGAISGVRSNGEQFPIEASISQVAVGDHKLFSVILRDRTERQRIEQQVERAMADAEAAGLAKDHFLAVLSHELRTPLTPVLTAVSMLQNDPGFDLDTRESLEMIRRNVELEAKLIDDLLDVTRIARGKVELNKRPVELCEIIRRAVEVCQADIEAKHLVFHADRGTDGPYCVYADPARLQQVFWNLLKNAVKFTQHGGTVSVRCRCEEGHVIAEISDSGMGIDAETLPHVFKPFEQGGVGTTRQFGGLGLGLTISKALVEMHGGVIQAHSAGKGQGSTFSIRLPLVASAPGEQSPTTDAAPAIQGTVRHALRILLVEDHGDTARVMRRLLIADGHEVEIAGDVAMALELAGSHDFDLIISDLGLPDGNGTDLMRELRARGQRMPGIALSGYGQEQDIQSSREAGFTTHLVKPTSPDRLAEAINAVAGQVSPEGAV